MKLAVGLVLAICVGIGCRWFGIPLPGPPAIMGAAMAVAMASGYTAADYVLTRKSNSAPPPTLATLATLAPSRTLPAAEEKPTRSSAAENLPSGN